MSALPFSSRQADERPGRWRSAGLSLALVLGLGAFLFNSALAACGLTLLLVESRRLEPFLTLPIFALAATGVGLGLPLVWQAVAGLGGWPSRRFALPLAGGLGLVLIFLMALAGGQAVLSLDLAPAWTLPPFHAVALALPPLILLWGSAALIRDPHYTWRQMWGGLGGAFGPLGLAFSIEIGLLLVGFVALVIVVMAVPELAAMFSRPEPVPDSQAASELMRLLLSQPAVILMLLAGLGLFVPLVEEASKSLEPALAGTATQPSVARLFLWGVASGAGFAVVEGMLNAGLSIQEWGSVALMRVGASAMHCFTAGLTGWGWGQVWTQRKWLRLLLAYLLAVIIHGVWNSISVGMIITSAVMRSGALPDALATVAIGLLALLTPGMIAALMILAKRLSTEIGGVT